MLTADSWKTSKEMKAGVRGVGGRTATTFPRHFAHCRKQMSSGAESNSFPKGKNQPPPSAQMTQRKAAAVSAIPEQNHFGVPLA